eukprot:1607279-Amphidinium_carterae.1
MCSFCYVHELVERSAFQRCCWTAKSCPSSTPSSGVLQISFPDRLIQGRWVAHDITQSRWECSDVT